MQGCPKAPQYPLWKPNREPAVRSPCGIRWRPHREPGPSSSPTVIRHLSLYCVGWCQGSRGGVGRWGLSRSTSINEAHKGSKTPTPSQRNRSPHHSCRRCPWGMRGESGLQTPPQFQQPYNHQVNWIHNVKKFQKINIKVLTTSLEELYQMFIKLTSILCKLFQKIEEEWTCHDSLYEVNITLMSKSVPKRKKNLQTNIPHNYRYRASLVSHWLRIHLPMQGTWVRALVQEDPTCCGATKPVCHNYWACALEPASHNYWAQVPQLLKPTHLERARAPQQEKPPQWEARAPQQRVAPARRN